MSIKIMQGNIIQEERRLFFIAENNMDQRATIIFEYHNESGLKNAGTWKFKACNYNTEHTVHTLEDWDFLAAVGKKIQELNETLNK